MINQFVSQRLCLCQFLCLLVFVFGFSLISEVVGQSSDPAPTKLFDQTFAGWEGDVKNTWRIENGTIVAGSIKKAAPRNEFLCTTTEYTDFELTLEFKTTGSKKINAGVQFRSRLLRKKRLKNQPIPIQQYHEVIGFQADIGEGYHGCLYDEHRRRKVLARPTQEISEKVHGAIPEDGWQTYRIRAVGAHIQLWLNGVRTVDYTESDKSIWRKGCIALQIHGNMVGTIAYRNIKIIDLSKVATKPRQTGIDPSLNKMEWICGHWTGEALGGEFEETWNPAMAGEMIGMFKLVQNDKVVFYELLTIVPKEGSYVLRLKHFGEGLVGWEEKDKSVEFPLISVSNTEIKFKGLRFRRESETVADKMVIEVETNEDGKKETMVFNCHAK